MANGKVVIDTLLDPSGFQKGLSGLQRMAPRGGNLFGRMFGGFGQFAKWTMGLQAIRSGISAVTAGFDEGIDRFDTMQRFPRMMQQIGFSAQDAEATIKRLSDEIIGLPTALDDITATTQRLTMMTGDMEKGADIALAMNNAFLASGASTADASRGMTQFTQMLSKGKPDMMAWNTLVETMPVALRMINKELGYSENDLYALYDALQEGEITYDDFTEAVIRASEAEGGFAEMARENSKGIRTSLTNLGIAFSRGWAEVLESINNGLQSIGIDGITGLLDGIRPHIDSFFDSLTAGIDTAFDGIRQLNEIFGWFDIPDESETLDNTAESAKNASAEIEELARQVINGDFGNGQERVEALGEQYQEIQDVVNAILNGDYEAQEIEVETEQVQNAEDDVNSLNNEMGKISEGTIEFATIFVNAGNRLSRSISTLRRGFSNAFSELAQGNVGAGIGGIFSSIGTFVGEGIDNAGYFVADIFNAINASVSEQDWQEIGRGIGSALASAIRSLTSGEGGVSAAITAIDEFMSTSLDNLFKGLLEGLGVDGIIADIQKVFDDIASFVTAAEFEGDLSAWAESMKQAFKDSFGDWNWNDWLPEVAYTDLNGNRYQLDWNKAIERMVSGFGDDPIDETIVMFELVPEIQIGDFNTDFRAEFESRFLDEDMYTEQEIDVITSYVIDDEGNLNAELVAMMEAQGLDPQQVTVPTIVDFILENWEELGLYDVIQEILGGGTPDFEVDYTVPVKPEVEVIEPDSDWRNYFEDNPMGEVQGSADLKIIPTSTTVTPTGQPTFDTGGVDLSTTTDQTVEVMASDGSVQVMSMTIDENGLPTLEPIDVTDELSLTGTADTSGVTADTSGITTIQNAYTQMAQHIQRMMMLAVANVRMGGAQMNMALAVAGGRMTSTARSITTRVVAIFNAMTSQMRLAGFNAGHGFADGLESTRGRIMNVAQSIANSASETIQNALDIHSPSRLWRKFGQFTGLGFAGGLDNTRTLVNQSALRLAEAGIPDFNAMSHALKSQSAPDASRIGGSMRDNTLLTEIRDAIRSGQVINLDGRNVSRGTSKYDNQYLGQAYQRGAYNAW